MPLIREYVVTRVQRMTVSSSGGPADAVTKALEGKDLTGGKEWEEVKIVAERDERWNL
jgi:hypothetical protein